jgi:hypothetical protein
MSVSSGVEGLGKERRFDRLVEHPETSDRDAVAVLQKNPEAKSTARYFLIILIRRE